MLQFDNFNLWQQGELMLRIVLSTCCGCFIGYERMNRNKVAGIRTHMIVALGAALMMIVSKYGFSDIANYDASRVAAQIVSGIGFLGAGVIFVRNNSISGLTTAAGIWATAGVGMAIGAGQYVIGIVSAALILLMQTIFRNDNQRRKGGSTQILVFELKKDREAIPYLKKKLDEKRITGRFLKGKTSKKGTLTVEMESELQAGFDRSEFLQDMIDMEYILGVEFK